MKIGYVASRKGEISLFLDMGGSPYIQVSLDPSIPQIPGVSIRVQVKDDSEFLVISKMAVTTLLEEVTAFLVGQNVSMDVVKEFSANALKALDKNFEEKDAKPIPESAVLLNKILESESSKLFEIEFDLPEAFFDDVYKNVVTASGTEYRRTDRAKPYKREHGIKMEDIPDSIDPKKVIKKYRNNIYKHTPSKNYILTYDINGRPTGMVEAPKSPMRFKSKLLK